MTRPGTVASDDRLRCRCQRQSPDCVLRATAEDMLCEVCRRGCNAAAWLDQKPLGHIIGPSITYSFPLGPGDILRPEVQ